MDLPNTGGHYFRAIGESPPSSYEFGEQDEDPSAGVEIEHTTERVLKNRES